MSKREQLPAIFTVTRERTAIDQLADSYYQNLLKLRPEEGVSAGKPGFTSQYSDYSPAGRKALYRLAEDTLAQLAGLEPVDHTDRITAGALRERLGLELELAQADLGYWEINNISCPIQQIRSVFDQMPRSSQQDWSHIIQRMRNIPAAIEGYIASLEEAKEKGHLAGRRHISAGLEQIAAYIGADGFFVRLAQDIIEQAPSLADEARAGAALAISGYAQLSAYLEEVLLPLAPQQDAVGRRRYSLYSRQFLGIEIDVEETYSWALAELEKIIARQQELAHRIKPGSTIAEAKQVLDQDPQRLLQGTAALQAWMQEVSDQAVAYRGGGQFVLEGPMLDLECRIAPTQEGGIYYTGPSEDFSRPGRMWWSVPAGETEFTTWRERTTIYHEGVPGHHLQFATTLACSGSLNSWRLHGLWVSGHGEGWALYAEELMEAAGFLDDPADLMGMLDGQRMRAARVVFDIGLHCGFKIPERWAGELGLADAIWDADSGFKFLQANLDISEGQLNFEFLRYLGWPGQASSYLVGKRYWDWASEQAFAAGESPADFYRRMLTQGSMGLEVFLQALDRSA